LIVLSWDFHFTPKTKRIPKMENERQKSPRQIATTEIEKDLDQLGSALQKIDKDLKVFYTEWSEKLDAIVEGITKEIRIYPELSFTKNLQIQKPISDTHYIQFSLEDYDKFDDKAKWSFRVHQIELEDDKTNKYEHDVSTTYYWDIIIKVSAYDKYEDHDVEFFWQHFEIQSSSLLDFTDKLSKFGTDELLKSDSDSLKDVIDVDDIELSKKQFVDTFYRYSMMPY
jgi:hypothetical protein